MILENLNFKIFKQPIIKNGTGTFIHRPSLYFELAVTFPLFIYVEIQKNTKL